MTTTATCNHIINLYISPSGGDNEQDGAYEHIHCYTCVLNEMRLTELKENKSKQQME